jgi:23S rRNA (uracil1939-C5)-methyltransferase
MRMQNDIAEESFSAPDRADAVCSHFASCAGCQLQHLNYATQLREKEGRLRALLDATGLALPEVQLHPSPPLGYRNRIRLTLAEVDGQLRAGYLRNVESSKELGATFLPITECPIAAPILWRFTEELLALLNESAGTWLRNPNLVPDQIEIFTVADESRLQFTLYLRSSAKSLPKKITAEFNALCEALHTRVAELTGAGIALLPPLSKQRSRRNEQPRPGPAWGSSGLIYRVGEVEYWVPRGAFFQVNRFLIPELLALVTDNRSGQLAFDLYAGVGLFSRSLASRFAHVSAVEIAESAATALAATKLKNLHAIKATTLDFLRAATVERDRPELIVLDPPRTGAGPEVCGVLARLASPKLVYVSCSPETLPADLTTLAASGYRVDELHLFDLFPQTAHIETVAVLSR